jgi:hypothetical protein
MRRAVSVAMVPAMVLMLASCGGGSSNPFGSFASFGSGPSIGSSPATADPLDAAFAREAPPDYDPTILVPQVNAARPEPALRGLIIRATAIAPEQGYYLPQLKPVNDGEPDENGIVTLEFRAWPPAEPNTRGPERSRTLEAAAFFPDADLRRIEGFVILAEGNSISLAR